jgi:hypothetical protein
LKSLLNEYDFRYNKPDKFVNARIILGYCQKRLPEIKDNFPNQELTKFAQAMPEQYRNDNTITAYQMYYRGDKSEIAKWTLRPIPQFMEKQ